MADLQGRKIFKVFNQDFIVDERYTVTKELGQGAYGIVWYALALLHCGPLRGPASSHQKQHVDGVRAPEQHN